MKRDFTYIDDLVEGIVRLIDCVPEIGDAGRGWAIRFRRSRPSDRQHRSAENP